MTRFICIRKSPLLPEYFLLPSPSRFCVANTEGVIIHELDSPELNVPSVVLEHYRSGARNCILSCDNLPPVDAEENFPPIADDSHLIPLPDGLFKFHTLCLRNASHELFFIDYYLPACSRTPSSKEDGFRIRSHDIAFESHDVATLLSRVDEDSAVPRGLGIEPFVFHDQVVIGELALGLQIQDFISANSQESIIEREDTV